MDTIITNNIAPQDRSETASLNMQLSHEIEALEETLKQAVMSETTLIPILSDHLLAAGGKRLRPLLTLAMGRAFGDKNKALIGLAASIELLHSASLLHDDVVDESPLRRGRNTANQVWGNQSAVLVGDYVFASAFQLMVTAGDMRIMACLAKATSALAEGQVMELKLINDLAMSKEDYLAMIAKKTAYLFATAAQIGAILGHNDKVLHNHAFEYGMALGMEFQLVDDVMDYESQSHQMGKKAGDDFREGKVTLPILLLLERANDDEIARVKQILSPLKQRNEEDFFEIMRLLHHYDCLEDSRNLGHDYAHEAKNAITKIENMLDKPSSPLLKALASLPEETISRQS